jgi:hypothetical protein
MLLCIYRKEAIVIVSLDSIYSFVILYHDYILEF